MSAPETKKRGCFGTLLMVFFVVMGLSIVVGMIQSAGRAIGVLPTLVPTSTPTVTLTPTITPTPGPPTDTPVPTDTPLPTSTPVPVVGVSFEQICNVDERNMTDPQLKAHAEQFAGQTFQGWQGWVYDVEDMGNGRYDLEIAMKPRGLFWTRDIVVKNIPTELAFQFNVEQRIVFDGRVERVDYMLEVMCNPLYVDNFVLR